ncbi:DUF6327 family protein [Sediminicola sp. 1XM1-17]|uniref:DUF6327 family protein n=1 Tax=Sediminicola sp. 1XM1-17 TaxID=3127702 RepID=UPI003076D889
MKTVYSSFTEIDKRLRILNLQREIDREALNLQLKQAKTSLYPPKTVKAMLELLPVFLLPYIKKRWFSKKKKLHE